MADPINNPILSELGYQTELQKKNKIDLGMLICDLICGEIPFIHSDIDKKEYNLAKKLIKKKNFDALYDKFTFKVKDEFGTKILFKPGTSYITACLIDKESTLNDLDKPIIHSLREISNKESTMKYIKHVLDCGPNKKGYFEWPGGNKSDKNFSLIKMGVEFFLKKEKDPIFALKFKTGENIYEIKKRTGKNFEDMFDSNCFFPKPKGLIKPYTLMEDIDLKDMEHKEKEDSDFVKTPEYQRFFKLMKILTNKKIIVDTYSPVVTDSFNPDKSIKFYGDSLKIRGIKTEDEIKMRKILKESYKNIKRYSKEKWDEVLPRYFPRSVDEREYLCEIGASLIKGGFKKEGIDCLERVAFAPFSKGFENSTQDFTSPETLKPTKLAAIILAYEGVSSEIIQTLKDLDLSKY